ncbi:MAG TPA: hypothetical protein VKB88_08575 [Bryobacteraceae bacterium]|nr:hypothetical protein [Bryobacteraceae bacterium]
MGNLGRLVLGVVVRRHVIHHPFEAVDGEIAVPPTVVAPGLTSSEP